jgi:RNA polymerase sigma-70 factor, ECF subfamily
MNDDARTDAELVVAAASGDDDAFGVLVRRHIRASTILAAQTLGRRDAAEDIVQEAFIVIHRQLGRFDRSRPFAPWCFGIVRRLAANRRARDQRRSRLLSLWSRVRRSEVAAPHQEQTLIAGLDGAAAKRAIETLSPMQRACFELVAVRGFSNEEVAAMHGISESTVRQHVFRARAVLKDMFSGSQERDRDY